MESLNLNTLATSLPTPYQNTEKDLVNNFKAAALSITTLYRSSRHASKRAYNAGYAAACNDLLMMIQQGVSVGGDSSGSGSSTDGMTIGKVMDWIEARMEAIKAREEEEDEEEEKEKDRERGSGRSTTTATSSAPAPTPTPTPTAAPKQADPKPTKGQANTSSKTKEQLGNTIQQHGNNLSHPSSSPSPPPPTSRQVHRILKSRSVKGDPQTTTTPDHSHSPQQPFTFISPETINSPPMTMSIAPLSEVTAGTKRRHAVMMMLDSPSSVSSGSSAPSPLATPGVVTTRRRTRSSRGGNTSHVQNQNVNLTLSSEAMDVEEDGRERKRVARR